MGDLREWDYESIARPRQRVEHNKTNKEWAKELIVWLAIYPAALILPDIFLWLVGSFVWWEWVALHPREWHPGSRLLYAAYLCVLTFVWAVQFPARYKVYYRG